MTTTTKAAPRTAAKPAAAKATKAPAAKSDPMAVCWGALGAIAKKQGDRDSLVAGSTPVELTISGKIGRKTIHEQLAGKLVVGADGDQTDNKKPDQLKLLATLLGNFSKAKRAAVLESLAGVKEPLEPAAELVADAEALINRLTIVGRKTKRGEVKFQHAPPF